MAVEFQGSSSDIAKAKSALGQKSDSGSVSSKVGGALNDLGQRISQQSQDAARAALDREAQNNARSESEVNARAQAVKDSNNRLMDKIPSFKRGGTMRKSGAAKLHRGERAAKRGGYR